MAVDATAGAAVTGDSVDEKAIRSDAEAFAKLYTAHDIKGLMAMFVPTAEMIDEDGVVTKGRDAIEQRIVPQPLRQRPTPRCR